MTELFDRSTRAEALATLERDELDVLVIGGGVTGAGIALDAATRGLSTGNVEMQDWSAGTSSRSSKLIHGGLRYLYNLDFALVAEALKERGLLLGTIAPHLVKAQPFMWPLKTPVIERAYSAVGVGLYDALSVLGSKGVSVPIQKHYTKELSLEAFPDIREDALIGSIRFYDARVDDARLVIELVRTAAAKGAACASRTQVVELLKDGDRVVGATLADLESGRRFDVRARSVISATGVWTEEAQDLARGEKGLQVLASKGVHLVFDRERIEGHTGLFLRTEKSVLFIIPWQRYWIIGTTDTPWKEQRQHPVATSEDIDYVLDHANAVLRCGLTRDDVRGTYAGLRPLLQPVGKGDAASTKVSREHTVAEVAPGLTAIAGGKYTTYRVMAKDAVDFALGAQEAARRPCVTDTIPLLGAHDLERAGRELAVAAERFGWSEGRQEHLLGRYGSQVGEIVAACERDAALAQPLPSAPAYLGAEVEFAVTHEGALHLEDILQHRIRLSYETRDRGVEAMGDIVAIAGPLLGWDEETTRREQENWRAVAAAEDAAERQDDDAAAEAARLDAPNLVSLAD